MKVAKLWNTLDLLQQRRSFKLICTGVLAAIAVIALVSVIVAANSPGTIERVQERMAERGERAALQSIRPDPIERYRAAFDDVLLLAADGSGVATLATATALALAGALVVVWLGVGITYLGLALIALGVGFPLTLFEPTRTLGAIVIGVTPLALLFVSLMQLLRLALAPGVPMLAVARNVLAEAVRMKISLVFIVMVLLLLALVPQLLNEDQPLRFRVQQWMQFGTGLSYLIMALLTVFLSAATITFEQRDRIIWQTMTKPIGAISYLAGKWLGVMGLNLVLLTVVGAGVFLFTEYLRRQPANNEIVYMVRDDGVDTRARVDLMTADRRLLETQVLVARTGVEAVPVGLTDQAREQYEQAVEAGLEARIEQIRVDNPEVVIDQGVRDKVRKEVSDELIAQMRTIPRGGVRQFLVSGLGGLYADMIRDFEKIQPILEERADKLMRDAGVPVDRDLGSPDRLRFIEMAIAQLMAEGIQPRRPAVTLRYKINSGSNVPGDIYTIYFNINGDEFRRESALAQMQSVEIEADLIGRSTNEDELLITILNSPENPYSIMVPPEGLDVLMPAGSYLLNYLRVMAVMWLKLGFIAAITIAAGTIVSFPVACLIAFVTLFAAESASGLAEALDFYYKPGSSRYEWWRAPFYYFGTPIAWSFEWYAQLKPTENLVSGRLLPWSALAKGSVFLVVWIVIALGAGVAVFRRRELALYSGN
ncbi:MAG: hypothetical protein ACTS3F_07250 [Phycisphaerales bacterium]